MVALAEHCRTILDLDPARQAVRYDGHWFTWGDVKALSEQLWAALEATGIPADAPVTLIPRNRPSALTAVLALLAQGRTIRMVYAFQSPEAIARSVERLDSAVTITQEADFSPELRAAMQAGGMAGVVIGEDGPRMVARVLEGLDKARPRPAEDPETEGRVEILTSGTTGPPKQFPLPHKVIEKYIAGQGFAGLNADFNPDEPPLLFTFPIGNISGIYSSAASIMRGKRVIMLDRFTIEDWHRYVLEYRPVSGGAPPAAINMILDAKIPKEDLSSIKYFNTGAAPLDPTVQKAFEETYGIPILLSYGATEFGGPVAAMTPQLYEEFGPAKFGTVGRPMPGARLRVVDPETGAELPPGEEGLLEVVSPRMGPEWIRTSDLAVIDADGFLFHRGRADGAIMRGGFKVLPETIERALLLHPAISAAGVVGVKDERLYQVPAAAVQFKPGVAAPSFAELEEHLRKHVLSTHIPVHWRAVDSLPKNPSFKIDRPALRAMFEDAAPQA